MSKKPFFTGPFAPLCESYVAQKRASGLDYTFFLLLSFSFPKNTR